MSVRGISEKERKSSKSVLKRESNEAEGNSERTPSIWPRGAARPREKRALRARMVEVVFILRETKRGVGLRGVVLLGLENIGSLFYRLLAV